MKLNVRKCKFILFNPTLKYDFVPELEIEGSKVETAEEIRLLGLTVSNDLSWKANTKQMIVKAYKRLWMVKWLKKHGANEEDLKDVLMLKTM